MKHLQLLMIFALPVLACCNNSPAKRTQPATISGSSPSLPVQNPLQPSFVIFNNDTLPASIKATGYGYNIFLNGKLYIHQPVLPAANGNAGFTSEEKAATTARLVVYKIQQGIIPPGVSVGELDSLGVR